MIAILIGLALPQVVLVLFSGIAVYVAVPFRELARLLSGAHDRRQDPAPASGWLAAIMPEAMIVLHSVHSRCATEAVGG